MTQGLFTGGTSIEELLAKRNTRANALQQSLMANAAQGAARPMQAQAASLIGSSLGRALAGNMGGEDKEMDALKAQNASQAGLVKEYAKAATGSDIAAMYRSANNMIKTGDPKAIQMGSSLLQRADQLKSQEAAGTVTSVKAEDEAKALAATTAQNNALADTVASFMTPEDVANIRANNKDAITYAYKLKGEKRKQKASVLAGTDPSNKLRFTEVGTFSDGKGNMYNATQSTDPKGKATMIYTGIGGSPIYDAKKQKLSPTNTAGLTQEQQVNMIGAKEEAKVQAQSWEGAKVAAREAHVDLLESQSFVTRALDILPKIRTGGLVVEGAKAFTDAFGITTDNVGEFHVLTASTALGMLKTTFGASPTEGEREILMSIQASIGNSKGLNKRILGRAKAMVEFRLKMNSKALTAKDAREYDAFLLEQEAPTWVNEEPEAQPIASSITPTVQPKAATMEWGDIPE